MYCAPAAILKYSVRLAGFVMMLLPLIRLQLSFIVLPLIFSLSALQQQIVPHVLAVDPSAGPPGTAVTLIDVNGSMAGKFCYARINDQDQRIAPLTGRTLSYIIPTFATPGTQIVFFCTGGTDGQQSVPAVFTVTPFPTDPPPPPPLPEPEIQPPVPPEPTQPPPPTIILPQLPTGGACVVATREAFSVNVRQEPSLDAPIVGQLDPTQIYEAAGRDGHGDWIDLISYNPGWVSVTVIRMGGDCSMLPLTDGLPEDPPLQELGHVVQQPAQAGLLLPAIQQIQDMGTHLADCPQYVPALDQMPMHLVLFVVGEPDPCAAAQEALDDLFFGPPPVSMQEMQQCPEDQPGWDVYHKLRQRTLNVDKPTRDYLDSLPFILPDHIFCLLLWDLSGGVVNEGTFPADEHVMPVAFAYCDNVQGFGMSDIRFKVEALDMPVKGLRQLNQACILFEHLRVLGSVNVNNVDFFNMVIEHCGGWTGDASQRAFSDAIRGALDAAAAAAQGCAGMQLLDSYPLPPDLQPMLPQVGAGNSTCAGRFRVLATHNSDLGLRTLYRILKSSDPCEAADTYVHKGTTPVYVVSPPACIQGEQMTLQGPAVQSQVILDASSPWWMKISALDRPLDELCSPISQADPGGLAILPTPTLGELVAQATPTPPIIVALPTPTLGEFAAQPTSTPEMGEAAEPEADPPTPLPPGDEAVPEPPPEEGEEEPPVDVGILPTPTDEMEPPPPADVVAQAPMDTQSEVPCFGCVPANPLVFGGQVQAVVVANNPDGSFAGLWVAPALRTPVPPDVDPSTLEMTKPDLIELPLRDLPVPAPGYPASLSPDGTLVGYFAHGVDPESLRPATQKIMIVVTDGAADMPSEHMSLNYTKISPDVPADGSLVLALSLSFPPELSPAPYPPVWVDNGTIILTLVNPAGVESIYRIEFDDESDTAIPELLVENAAAAAMPTELGFGGNNRNLAFERVDETGRNVYVMALNSMRQNPLTRQLPGAECYGPSFGADPYTVFFTCQVGDERQMYAYGLQGVQPIETGIPNAQNPRSSGVEGFILFDDGRVVYQSVADGSRARPYLEIEMTDVLISSYQTGGSSQ